MILLVRREWSNFFWFLFHSPFPWLWVLFCCYFSLNSSVACLILHGIVRTVACSWLFGSCLSKIRWRWGGWLSHQKLWCSRTGLYVKTWLQRGRCQWHEARTDRFSPLHFSLKMLSLANSSKILSGSIVWHLGGLGVLISEINYLHSIADCKILYMCK